MAVYIFVSLMLFLLEFNCASRTLGIVQFDTQDEAAAQAFLESIRAAHSFSVMDITIEAFTSRVKTIEGEDWPQGYSVIVINFRQRAMADGFFETVMTAPDYANSNIILVDLNGNIGAGFGELAISDVAITDAEVFANFQAQAQQEFAKLGGHIILRSDTWTYEHQSTSTVRHARLGSTLIITATHNVGDYNKGHEALDSVFPIYGRGADINTYAFARTN